jgi:hypothetical protein
MSMCWIQKLIIGDCLHISGLIFFLFWALVIHFYLKIIFTSLEQSKISYTIEMMVTSSCARGHLRVTHYLYATTR